uniref:Uncharacterized protein n=2 Tax=Hemiselmis andersenii TaxID=464988 RepID=A0A6T8KEF1_HEMAN|mmetsp:Transcript_1117/g.2617  ORF Transcript_1117/g.2617 Transcript_1117/m.2617 type:complete len:728 (-) Transcript_1117:94-2277(-)
MPRARARAAGAVAAEGARNRARAQEKEREKLRRRELRKQLKKQRMEEMGEAYVDEDDVERFELCNIVKVLEIVREKKKNSKMAFSLMRYVVFIALYLTVVVTQRNAWSAQSMYSAIEGYMLGAYRDTTSLELLTFEDLTTTGELWDWLEKDFVGLLYVEQQTNYDPYPLWQDHTFMRFNRVTTGFRIAQRRSKRENCNLGNKKWDTFVPFGSCHARTYGESLFGAVDKEPFFSADAKTEYSYETVEVGLPGSGSFDVGYFQYFDLNQTFAKEKLQELKRQRWLNEGTQWCRIEAVVYNPNLGAFGVLQFVMDFDNSGFFKTRFNKEIINAANYANYVDAARAALEFMVVLLWGTYVLGVTTSAIVLAKLEKKTWAYFQDPINCLFTGQLVMFALCGGLWVTIVNDPSRSNLIIDRVQILDKSQGPPSFTSSVLLNQAYYISNGLNILLSVFRLLSFFRVNHNLSMLTDTLGFMIGELFQFGFVLLTLLVAFMVMTHIYFGQYLSQFSSLDECFVNVFEFLFSQADFFILAEMDFVAAYIFFIPFTFIMVFVVSNITIAIILDGYTAMQARMESLMMSNIKVIVELSFLTQVWHGFVRSLSPIRRLIPKSWSVLETPNGAVLNRFTVPSRREVLDMLTDQADYDNPVTVYALLKEKLKEKEYTDEERILSVFDRYDAWVDPIDIEPDVSELQIKQFTILKQSIYTIMADQKRIDAKINTLVEIFPTLP